MLAQKILTRVVIASKAKQSQGVRLLRFARNDSRVVTLCLCAIVPLCLVFMGCKKKDRLSVTTALIKVSPAAMAVSLGGTQTFTATGVSASGDNFSVSPTWTLNPASGIGSLNTNTGSSVTFTAVGFGTTTLRAATSDLTGEAQIRVDSAAPASGAVQTIVYDDNGLPQGKDSDIFVWQTSGSNATLSEIIDTYAPEGLKYQRHTASNATFFGWGIVVCKTVTANCQGLDLSSFTSGRLRFNLRISRTLSITENLKIEIQDKDGKTTSPSVSLNSTHGFSKTNTSWQEITIPAASLFASSNNLDNSKVRLPFMVTAESISVSNGQLSFDVDNVRWER